MAPDGAHVVYAARRSEVGFRLFERSQSGLHGQLVRGARVHVRRAGGRLRRAGQRQGRSGTDAPLSQSLQRVVFFELGNPYSIRFDGAGRVQLDPSNWVPTVPFTLTPDGTSLLFHARVGGVFGATGGLLRARVEGSQPTDILHMGEWTIAQILPSDTRVAFVRREGSLFDPFGFRGLWSQAIDGATPAVLLTGPALARTGCEMAQLARGDRVLFSNSFSTSSIVELFATLPR